MSNERQFYYFHGDSDSFFVGPYMHYNDDELIARIGEVEKFSFSELKQLLKSEKHHAYEFLHEFTLPEGIQMDTELIEMKKSTLTEIRNANCEGCKLSLSCNTVCVIDESQINPKAKLMVVIDTMAEDVDETGDVFNNFKLDKFFQVFDKAITDSSRDEIYFTYLTKCMFPDKGLPNEEDMQTCIDTYLQKEIDAIEPKCILTLGEGAFRAMTGKTNVLIQNGDLFDYKGIPLIPTLSPAYVNFNESKLEYFAKDIYRAYGISKGVKTDTQPLELKILTTIPEIEEFCKYVKEVGEVSFDLETTGLLFDKDKITIIGFSFNYGGAYVIPIFHYDSPFTEEEIDIILYLLTVHIFYNEKVDKIAWNMKFDTKFLKYLGVRFRGRLEDAMLMHHILDENTKHRLKDVAKLYYSDSSGYEQEVSKYKWEEVPLEILAPYCVMDTDLTLRLYHEFMDRLLEEPELYRLYRNFTAPALKLLDEVEFRGVRVDTTLLNDTVEEMKKRIEKLEISMRNLPQIKKYEESIEKKKRKIAITKLQEKMETLKTEAGKEKSKNKIEEIKTGIISVYDGLNFNSSVQLGELLYSNHGFNFPLPYVKKKRKRERSTAEEYIIEFREKTELVDMLLESRSLSKLLSTYLEGIRSRLDDNGYVHTNYNIHGTVTGRLSSSNPNLQNIPRSGEGGIIKKLFVPEGSGRTLIQVDYSQAELRIAAYLANDETMIEVYKRGEDIHKTTAQKIIMGISDEEWKGLDSGTIKKKRTDAKGVNFGLIYGMGWKSLIEYCRLNYGVGFTENEAKTIRANYFNTYSRLTKWHKTYKKKCEEYGYVKTLFGRRRRLPGIYSPDEMILSQAERNAINSPVQGTGGELTIFAACLLKHRLDPSSHLILTVHDSLIFSIDNELLETELPIIKDTCENALTDDYFGFNFGEIKMEVDFEQSEENWGSMKEISV